LRTAGTYTWGISVIVINPTSRGFDVLKEGLLMIEIEKTKIETVEINDYTKYGNYVV
jgi:hypothetical protein